MSFGFEVRAADGSVQLDTTTWGWQFVTTITINVQERNVNRDRDTSNGSIVFDGQGGRPFVPAGSELYAMNCLNIIRNAHMIRTSFAYQTEGAFRKLSWGKMRVDYATEDNSSYDGDRLYSTVIYVFAR